jgi:metallo-beta-lactamase family protein
MPTLTFHGGARSVTGANYLIETETSKILVDCGLIQGTRHAEKQNYEKFPYDPAGIDAVLVTHAHIDHTGRLPKLVKDGFRGKIFMTRPARDFAEIMLADSQALMADEAKSEKEKPLYSKEDVARTLEFIETAEYGEVFEITDDTKFRFRDAGHILGSAIIELWAENKKIVFSGDLGNPPVPLLRPTEFIDEADYVVVESTYGDREHEKLDERKNMLEDVIEDTFAQGGTLMIPSFALERTQELLYELNSLVENHRIPRIPIFIDSPLAICATKIYKKYPQYYNEKAVYLIESGDQLFQFPGLKFTYTTEESKEINDVPPPKIVIAGSGMSTGGRILHHERRYLSDPNSFILFIGYQAAGTLGRRIADGAKEVKIFGETVPVLCGVRAIGGYSAHADQAKLREWVEKIKEGGKLKKTFVVQGEEGPALAFVQLLRDHLGIDAEAPMAGDIVKL